MRIPSAEPPHCHNSAGVETPAFACVSVLDIPWEAQVELNQENNQEGQESSSVQAQGSWLYSAGAVTRPYKT